MANLYSKFLFGGAPGTSGVFDSDPVPSGKVWVVRSADFVIQGAMQEILTGFQLTDGVGHPIFARLFPFAQPNSSYHWDGHQVLNESDFLEVVLSDNGWSWRISGYELSLP